MVLKEENHHAVMVATRTAVQAAEHEGRPELCTNEQATVSSNSNVLESTTPITLGLIFKL